MAKYFSPNESKLSISDKKYIFAMRNKMIQIHGNFSSRNFQNNCKAGCPDTETMEHIYHCKIYTKDTEITKYEHIYKENMKNMTTVFYHMKENLKLRDSIII